MTKAEVLAAALRGDGPLGRAADDEPVFVLIARDVLASSIVRAWADLLEASGAHIGLLTPIRQATIAEARALAAAMERWPARTLPE